MKLCFSTLGCHDASLKEILELAQNYDVSAIEVRGIQGVMVNSDIECFQKDHIAKTKEMMKQAHVIPLILGTSCKFHDPQKVQSMIQRAFVEIELAHQLGFKAIRVFGNNILDPQEECIERVANALDEVCLEGQKKHMQIYLEVHGDFNTSERLQSVIDKMNHKENFALIWDIYHTYSVYGKQWKDFYEAMKPWIKHVHLKDSIGKKLTLPNEGELEIVPMIQHLMKDGYSGWFSLEWERKWEPELPPLKDALDCLCQLLKNAGIQIENG